MGKMERLGVNKEEMKENIVERQKKIVKKGEKGEIIGEEKEIEGKGIRPEKSVNQEKKLRK